MDRVEIALQYLINGLMLGIMYGLVAVGFTLFFGVLDVIKFSTATCSRSECSPASRSISR